MAEARIRLHGFRVWAIGPTLKREPRALAPTASEPSQFFGMLTLVVIFLVIGSVWLLGLRYVAANWRWFRALSGRATKGRQTWETTSWQRRPILFMRTLLHALRMGPGLFSASGDSELRALQAQAGERFRTYSIVFGAFAAFGLLFMLVLLVIIAVHAVL